MITIGLVGGIAAGKSEVGRLLAERGARVVDADRLAHETYLPGTPGFAAIVEAFGEGVVGADGAVDRRLLGELVFAQPERLARLSAIVWPLTRARLEQLARAAEAEGVSVFVVEAALLIEAGWRDMVDEVWFVRVSPAVARERLLRRGLSEAEAEQRIAARSGIEAAEQAATRIIDNDADLAALEKSVAEAWLTLRSQSG